LKPHAPERQKAWIKATFSVNPPGKRLGAVYASGVGRRWIGLFWQPAFEPGRVFFVHPEEIDQVFDAEVGERLDTI
jgi:hypothetical protein